jgi:DNA invertase Pin-like site-specific DNA recombinase
MTTQQTYEQVPAYARLSKKKRGGQIESIPLQFATLGRLADYGGHTIGRRFDDKHLSAWDESVDRPGWEAFLAELDTGSHRAAMSYHADRLSRNGVDTERLLSVGARHGIVLITPEGVYDLGNDDSRAMFRMLAAMTINQSDAGSRRARNHKNEARRLGNLRIVHGGPPPLGFRQGSDDWEVDPAGADYLNEAARRVLAGEPVDAVHRDLGPITTSPAGPDSPGRLVSAKMLRAALTRPVSAGLITDTEGNEIGSAEQGGPLDEPTFRKLAVNFGSRKRGRPVETGRYPLGPVLRCGKCGNQLTGERQRNRRSGEFTDYYACKNPHKALKVTRPCHGCSVPAEDVHVLVRDAVMAWAATPAAMRAAARGPETAGRRAELDAELADLLGQAADLDAKRLRIRQAAARARYDDLAAEAERMIAGVEAELAELERIEAEGGVPVVIDWDAMSAAEKLRTIAEAIETPIVVQPGNGGGAARTAADRIDITPR